MDFLLPLLIGLVVGLVIGALAVLALQRGHPTAQAAADSSAEGYLRTDLAAAEATVVALREQLAATQQREKQQNQVLEALAPVRETLRAMSEKVAELERERTQQYGSIAEQLRQARASDEQLRGVTESLAGALRSNSTRGVWGETQLRRVVEAAGLLQYVDFAEQQTIDSDAGRGRPDMVIKLPGGKAIAVDSKVPLEHYIEASAIPETANGEEAARRTALLAAHVRAVRAHIDALAKKAYWLGLSASPEFVICFVPSESLLSAALEADPSLLDYAFGKRVALASPVNLWAVLKTVAITWQQQAVTDEARTLFELGNTLYQRISTMAGHADALRKAIERTVASYNSFAGALESRVLVTARQFPGIDIDALAALPATETIEEIPRPLTALELTEQS